LTIVEVEDVAGGFNMPSRAIEGHKLTAEGVSGAFHGRGNIVEHAGTVSNGPGELALRTLGPAVVAGMLTSDDSAGIGLLLGTTGALDTGTHGANRGEGRGDVESEFTMENGAFGGRKDGDRGHWQLLNSTKDVGSLLGGLGDSTNTVVGRETGIFTNHAFTKGVPNELE